MTLTTIAPGVRLLRRHPATDVLIVEGLGDWPTYFVESIPGGWCVVNGEQATTRIVEQITQCEQGMTPEENMMNLPDGWRASPVASDVWCATGDDDGRRAVIVGNRTPYAIIDGPVRNNREEAEADRLAMVWALDPTRRAETARLKDALQHVTHALADIAKPGETPERTIANLLADLDRAVFMFVVKDTDEIHVERVERDRAEFDRLIKRAESVVFASEPPPKISNDPAWFECKFCHFHAHCHGSAAPAATCRTCAHVTPERDGTWTCERHTIQLSEDVQRQGCTEHRVIPILLANWAEQKDVVDGAVVYRNTLTGNTFMNGPRPDGYSSDELAACEDKRVIGEPDMKAFRDQFSGRVVA
jgi:hypothetical protein